MITGWILSALGSLGSFILGLFPTVDSSSTSGASGTFVHGIAGVISAAAHMDSWIPWEVIPIMLLIFGTTWGTSVVITVIRRIVSHFTGGGGAV